jgi:hypothetical protein
MNRNLLTAALGLLASTALVGALFVPAYSATSFASMHRQSNGLASRGIDNARNSGTAGNRVAMAPQSNLKLLSHASKLGPHARDSQISLTIALKLRHTAKLKRFLAQVQNSHSSVYHQWLTPAQFTKRYGPTRSDVAKVAAFLEAHHISVKNVSSNRMLIHTEASTETYEHAFGIRINDYKLDGRRFYSTNNRPKLPREIAPQVVNVLGLNHGVLAHTHSYSRPLAGARAVNPRAGEAPPASLTQLSPLQIAHAYNYPDITDDSNAQDVNVAIVTANSSGLADLSDPHDFWAAYSLPDHTINVIPVGGDFGDTDGMGETLLDIEYSGAMGPGIVQNVYVAGDAYLDTFADAYNAFTNATNPDGTAKNQVMTTSWGSPETNGSDLAVADEQIFMQAAAEGISMFAAAGDMGTTDNTTQYNVADYPSSSVYITAANGTQLNITDLDGTYGSEVAWRDIDCFGNGIAETGGAISQLFDKPDWQIGPGVPADIDMRMNSDMAATASCSKPMLVKEQGDWYITAGTSAVAPQFAGMFAIAVADSGAPLGQSNKLIYDDVNAGHYASDFHDVTSGCNGWLLDGVTESCAKADWDHPTGWGSPNVQNFLSHIGITGPKGTLKGEVTDAANGASIADAEVIATADDGTQYTIKTDDDGDYSRYLPTGNFDVKASKYGYVTGTGSVSISDGEATTKDFSLSTAPRAKLSGKVTDGSGHGYPLYAEVKINASDVNQVADLWTDPATGQYSVELPKGIAYTVKAVTALDGYNTASKTVDLSDDKTQNFALKVSATCTAPGYGFVAGGVSEDFNEGSFPPAGWTVTNPLDGNVVWELASQQPTDTDNWTGGTGDAAAADSNDNNESGDPFDTSLVTPPIAVTSLDGATVLKYKANYQGFNDALDLDISTDGGDSWTNISHWTSSYGSLLHTPGEEVQLDLAPYLPGSGNFQLRWRYYNLYGGWDWYAQIDDVVIGSCTALPGSLVTGQVTDAESGDGIVSAKVRDDLGEDVQTVANPADSNFPAGSYIFFASKGDRTLTVTDGNYEPATEQLTVPAGEVIADTDFELKGARFESDSNPLDLHVTSGTSGTASFALSNTGAGAGHFRVVPINLPAPVDAQKPGAGSIPLHLVHGADVSKTGTPRAGRAQHMLERSRGERDDVLPWTAARAGGTYGSNGTDWVAAASYPIPIVDNCAATDPATGKVYSFSGFTDSQIVPNDYVYDPASDAWSPIADLPGGGLAQAVCAEMAGKIYITDGEDHLYAENDKLYIYDIATDSFTTGADIPASGAFLAAEGVFLNGRLYVIGGCSGDCSTGVSRVAVYNPATDHWSTAADYPVAVAWHGCTAAGNAIYCGGGETTNGSGVKTAYKYDPTSDSWTAIADMLYGVWGMAASGANGKLLLQDGVTSEGDVTNQGQVYDPATDTWSALPNSPVADYRMAGACGFYMIGGNPYAGSDVVSRLPNFDRQCGSSGIPWLTLAPTEGTLKAGASTRVVLSLDGTKHGKFTTSKAHLQIGGSPYSALIVPITVHWDPKPVDLNVLGSVSPTGTVDKGDTLAYTITVENRADVDDAATQTKLSYEVPDNVDYLGANGATCAPPGGSSAAVGGAMPARVSGPATVSCDLGTIEPNASKVLTLTVQARSAASSIGATFKASAREPDSDTSNNTLRLETNPNAGPPGPTGPQGPKGDKGSGGLGLLGMGVLALLAAAAVALETRHRKGAQK